MLFRSFNIFKRFDLCIYLILLLHIKIIFMKPAPKNFRNPLPAYSRLTQKEGYMKKTFCLLAVVLLFGLSTAQVDAQDTEVTEDGESSETSKIKMRLAQVTVSATKTERDPLTTPGEVSVLTQEYFQQRQAQSLDDVLRYEPGVDSESGPRSMGEGPNIRGLSGARVLTLLDGVRLNFQSGHRGRLFIDMDQLKQVEVIRGPGSALYGSQALGGVVAMETKDPSDYLAPDMKYGIRQKFGYQYANEELLSTTTLSARLTKQLEVMASGTFRAGENVRLGGDLGRLSNSAQDTVAGLAKLVWKPTPHDEAEFSIQATRQAARIPFVITSQTSTSISDRVNRQVTYRMEYTHNNPANPYVNLRGFVYLTTLDVTQSAIANRQKDDIRFDTFGYDLRNSMNFGDPSSHHHIVTFGSEFYRNSQEGKGNRRDRSGNLTGAALFFPSGNSDVFALYLQDEITIMNRLNLIPAVRWDHWENSAPGQTAKSVGTVNPKIGAVFQVTDFLFLTANYAHGFRQPTFGDLFVAGAHFSNTRFRPNPDLNPERSRNIDAGFRVNLPNVLSNDDQFIFKGAYFRNQLRDFIATASVCENGRPPIGLFWCNPSSVGNFALADASFTFVNVTKAIIQGWEAQFEWRVLKNVTLSGNYSQSHGTDETRDVPLPNIPQKRGVLSIDYRYPPWGLTLGGRSQFVADQDQVPFRISRGVRANEVNPTPGYTLFDIWATVEPARALLPDLPKSWLQGFRVNLGVDNLFDRKYRRHLSPLPEAGINPKISFWYSLNLP